MITLSDDKYHCNCFSIDNRYTAYLNNQLLQNGFTVPVQENHGQVIGLAKDIDDTMQFHIKVMPDGRVEAEVEPQTKYVEHLNQEYSSPGHSQVEEVLQTFGIPNRKHFHSWHCITSKIKRPSKTTTVASVLATIAVVGLGLLLIVVLTHIGNRFDYRHR